MLLTILLVTTSRNMGFEWWAVVHNRGLACTGRRLSKTTDSLLPADQFPSRSDVASELPFEFSRTLTPRLAGIEGVAAGGRHAFHLGIAPRLIDLMLSAQENTHVNLGEQQGATIAFIETGFANGLDRNMSRPLRQQLSITGM